MMTIREGTKADDAALRELTALSPMAGTISVRSDREPYFFRLLERRGPYTVLLAEAEGRVVGCVSAARLRVRIDGEPETVHYLGDLKTHPAFRRGGVAVSLLEALRARLERDGADLVVCTAAAGNGDILPFFQGPAGLPRAVALGEFFVHQILPSSRRGDTGMVRPAVEAATDEICAFYDDFYRGYQFGPVITAESLRGARTWTIGNGGRIEAALSLVDLAEAKQNVLIRLPAALAVLAAGLRLVRFVLPLAELPRRGRPIRTLYIKALACRNGCEGDLARLLGLARRRAYEEGFHFLSVGLHANDPLRRLTAGLPKFTFRSLGYVIGLRRTMDDLVRLKQRVPFEDYSLA